MGGGTESWYSQDPYPRWVIDKQENNCGGSSQGVRGPAPTLGSPAGGPAPGRQVPKTLSFEGHWGLLLGESEDYGKQRLHS